MVKKWLWFIYGTLIQGILHNPKHTTVQRKIEKITPTLHAFDMIRETHIEKLEKEFDNSQ